jgi:hypothetical protein
MSSTPLGPTALSASRTVSLGPRRDGAQPAEQRTFGLVLAASVTPRGSFGPLTLTLVFSREESDVARVA